MVKNFKIKVKLHFKRKKTCVKDEHIKVKCSLRRKSVEIASPSGGEEKEKERLY